MRLDDLKVEYRSLDDQTTVAKNAYTQVLDSSTRRRPPKASTIAFRSARSTAPSQLRSLRAEQGPHQRTCLLAGLGVFFGVAFGLSLIDDRIKSAWDVDLSSRQPAGHRPEPVRLSRREDRNSPSGARRHRRRGLPQRLQRRQTPVETRLPK